MRDGPDDSLGRILAGPHGGVYVAVAVCGILAVLAHKAHVRNAEQAFRERGEVLPVFPFQPPRRFDPEPEAPGPPQPPGRPGDTDLTGPSGFSEGWKRLDAIIRGLSRDVEEGAGR